MLLAKGLIKKEFESTGIQYYATETARVFLDYFDSPYASRAKHVSAWVRDTFQRLPNDALESIVRPIYGTWSLEMSGDSDLEGM